jgi:hypothetical protein
MPVILLVFGFVALTGCQRGLRRIPVSGTVTLDGKPLAAGLLMFNADPSKGNTARAACTGRVKDGHFTLITSAVEKYNTGGGAPLGWYKVTVVKDLPGLPILPVHPRYLDPQKSPVSIEIVDDPKPGAYDIQLKTK